MHKARLPPSSHIKINIQSIEVSKKENFFFLFPFWKNFLAKKRRRNYFGIKNSNEMKVNEGGGATGYVIFNTSKSSWNETAITISMSGKQAFLSQECSFLCDFLDVIYQMVVLLNVFLFFPRERERRKEICPRNEFLDFGIFVKENVRSNFLLVEMEIFIFIYLLHFFFTFCKKYG